MEKKKTRKIGRGCSRKQRRVEKERLAVFGEKEVKEAEERKVKREIRQKRKKVRSKRKEKREGHKEKRQRCKTGRVSKKRDGMTE